MATGRTLEKWTRMYVDGYDLSGFGRSVGPLEVTFDEHDLTAWMDQVKGYLRGNAQVNPGTFNGVFDNTAVTGIHAALGAAGAKRTVTVAKGIRAAPSQGDPCFCGQFVHKGYQVTTEGGVFVTAPFSGWAANAETLLYAGPWGQVLHPMAAATAANTAAGIDNYAEASTAKGGYLIYHITASNAAGTCTISVDDSADNAVWLPLAGATSAAIGFAALPASGVIALSNAATVRRYLRWQLALAGGMTTVTFFSAFVRAYYEE